MASIAPFRGFIYNSQIIKNYAQVVTPPYDVIKPQEQERLYQQNPYNVVRLDFGKNFPSDTPGDNRYTRADRMLQIWKKEQILIQDPEPAIYLYKIQYQLPGQSLRTRTGFISLLGLEPFETGKVRPHEKTFSAFKQDRYQLFEHCQMQFCPIFSFYIDPENRILSLLSGQAPTQSFIDFVDQDAIRHQLWKITDHPALSQIQKIFDDKTVYIADGHHRYETSLAYQANMLKKHPGLGKNAPFNYTLMFLCPMEDPGLTIFPVHRALNRLFDLAPALLEKKLNEDFIVEKFPFDSTTKNQVTRDFFSRLGETAKEAHGFGLFMAQTSWFYLLTLKPESLDKAWGEDLPPLLRRLDVMILSRLIFQKVLGVRREELDQENIIEYRHDRLEVLKLVEKGQSQMGFILNPTPIEQVRQIAEASLVMPRKSTYFYPKTLTGLVMNSLALNESILA
ncbi:MAG: DUF1015 domain-containing protein [Thermodesulfobacteriota bacterium]